MALPEQHSGSEPHAPVQKLRAAQLTLLFDADDTLWENNIYFERAIADFISFLDHRTHSPEEVREHLNVCERATIAEHGYGLPSFRRSLVRCFEDLTEQPVTPDLHNRIVAFTNIIADAEIELLPDVAATLADLAQRHRLLLVTKGVSDEQLDKLERSSLRPFFAAAEVVPEKNVAAYRRITATHECPPEHTWMIGNSPRSDINPALAAGLNAVFLPHDQTWVLEHETLDAPAPGQTLLKLTRFAELTEHF